MPLRAATRSVCGMFDLLGSVGTETDSVLIGEKGVDPQVTTDARLMNRTRGKLAKLVMRHGSRLRQGYPRFFFAA
jgi:hypothetical protein